MALAAKLRSLIAGLPRTFWLLWAGTLVNRIATFVVPFMSLYLTQQRHLSIAWAGLVVSLFGAGGVGASLVGGFLADRIGRRPTMIFSLVASGLGTMVLGWLQEPVAIAGFVLLLGFAGECYRPAVSAAVADVVAPEDRTRAFGLIYWAVNLGFSIGLALAGFMVRLSYTLLFVADGFTSLTFALLVWRAIPETRVAGPSRENPLKGMAVVFRDLNLVLFALLSFVFASLMFQTMSTMPIDWVNHGLTPQQYGLLGSLNCIGVVLLQPVITPWLKRFPRANVLAGAGVLLGTGFGLNAFFHTMGQYAFGVLIWTLGEVCFSPIAPSVIADIAPVEYRGRYQGVWSMSWGFANFLGTAAGSFVMMRAGAKWMWIGCFGAGLVLAAGQLAIAPRRRRMLAARGLGALEEGAVKALTA